MAILFLINLLRKSNFIYYLSCITKASFGSFPINATIRNRYPVLELVDRSWKSLVTGIQMAFKHNRVYATGPHLQFALEHQKVLQVVEMGPYCCLHDYNRSLSSWVLLPSPMPPLPNPH